MEEKTTDIDILEDYIELIEKGYCEDCNELCNISTAPVYPSKAVAQAISNLIAENKELKEEKEELKRENLEIRDWKYVIDSPIDLDKLKELDLIKIKGKEYISKSIYNELEKDKKALVNNYSNVLGYFISVDKIKAKIEELKETADEDNKDDFIRIEILQSLLGKE